MCLNILYHLVTCQELCRYNADTKIAAVLDTDGTVTENHMIAHSYFKANIHFICHYL